MDIKDFKEKDLNSFDDEFATREWICDKCGKVVDIENARIAWKFTVDKNQIPHLIVPLGIYHKDCAPRFARSDFMAQPYLKMEDACYGPDGLSMLLDYAEQIPQLHDDFLELIRRIFIPRYERLHKFAKIALDKGTIQPNDVAITPDQTDFDEIEKDIKTNPEQYKHTLSKEEVQAVKDLLAKMRINPQATA